MGTAAMTLSWTSESRKTDRSNLKTDRSLTAVIGYGEIRKRMEYDD